MGSITHKIAQIVPAPTDAWVAVGRYNNFDYYDLYRVLCLALVECSDDQHEWQLVLPVFGSLAFESAENLGPAYDWEDSEFTLLHANSLDEAVEVFRKEHYVLFEGSGCCGAKMVYNGSGVFRRAHFGECDGKNKK